MDGKEKLTEGQLRGMLMDEKKKKKKSKRTEKKFSKKIVTFVIVANILFVVAILYVFLRIGSEPTVLIGSWFAFTTVELWSLAGITKREKDLEIRERQERQEREGSIE